MPSFVCDYCQETLKKAKLDQHTQRCRNASFSCIDCYKSFQGTEYRSHFSCISEEQKYHKKPVVAVQKKEEPVKAEQVVPIKTVQSTVKIEKSEKAEKSVKVEKSEKAEKSVTSALIKLLKQFKEPVSLKVLKSKAKKESKDAKKELKKLLKDKVMISLNASNELTFTVTK